MNGNSAQQGGGEDEEPHDHPSFRINEEEDEEDHHNEGLDRMEEDANNNNLPLLSAVIVQSKEDIAHRLKELQQENEFLEHAIFQTRHEQQQEEDLEQKQRSITTILPETAISPIEVKTIVDEDNNDMENPSLIRSSMTKRRLFLSGLFGLVLLIGAIVLGIFVRGRNTGSSSASSLSDSSAKVIELMERILQEYPFLDKEAMLTKDTIQNRALHWMAFQDGWTRFILLMIDGDDSNSRKVLGERYSLVVFYFMNNGEEWKNHKEMNWLSNNTSICEWSTRLSDGVKGVSCNDEDPFVVSMDVATQGSFQGIPTEILLLSKLQSLNLSENDLSGSFPQVFLQHNSMISLATLDLSYNQISGTFPSEIGSYWTSLVYLDLNNNSFTGSLPTQIGLLSSALTHMDVRDNAFIGTIPTEIGSLTLLTSLNMESNQLSGRLPTELGYLTSLTMLDVANNIFLSGNIPTNLCALTSIESLLVHDTNLTGNLDGLFCNPPEVGVGDGVDDEKIIL